MFISFDTDSVQWCAHTAVQNCTHKLDCGFNLTKNAVNPKCI